MNAYDNERERTFEALPPAHGRGFAQSWWGRAWLAALEGGALDGEQVRTGRRLARAGAVGAVSVRPGRITAVVRDRDGTGYRADVLLDVLTDAQWDRFLDLTVERAGHVAALLDREMPPHLVEDAETAGIELLPGLGDLEAECGCDAWDHCGHTAALCYQVARLLDQDPFVLLLLRGRAEQALLADLQARSTAVPTEPEPSPQQGVDAVEAYLAGHVLPPLPAVPELPEQPGVPPRLDTEAPPPGEVEPAALEALAARTAAQAHVLLAEAVRGGAKRAAPARALTVGEDAVRLAAGLPGDRGTNSTRSVLDRLATGTGRSREQLALAVRAWRTGGVAALAVLEEEWAVEGEALARARAALNTAWEEDERPVLRVRGNRWTVAGPAGPAGQLRLGRDGRWWPYRKERGRWVPAGDAAQDPATALAAVGSEGTGQAE
ncbi:SWF or SNF family helicase [Streptomyces sp. ID05-39B]|uniref:SWIM zinc finger family protein n=1 Tax=Streptomyces sp. ID05-39B TaxID=3028664 RepID=UPI0029A679F9|nr:SWF or SNF family helicase [Streptomyces sp. ID05-39B]MDX3525126.1 SWF or SNF family helicase [Streptomyces sp. ID05-39B]